MWWEMKCYKDMIYWSGLVLLSAVLWMIIGQPESLNDIYQGIPFCSKPLGYMQHISVYLAYIWSCMGFMEPYLRQGGIYRLVRKKKKQCFLFQVHGQLFLHLCRLEILRWMIYSICFFLKKRSVIQFDAYQFFAEAAIHFAVLYVFCLLQILLEIWSSENVSFGMMWLIDLGGLFAGDFLYSNKLPLDRVIVLLNNLTMKLRIQETGISNGAVMTVSVLGIGILTVIFYITIKKRDFLKI